MEHFFNEYFHALIPFPVSHFPRYVYNNNMNWGVIKNENKLVPYDRLIKLFLPIIPEKLMPNHVTFFRLVCVPVLIFFLLSDEYLIALLLFIVMAFTDMLDGSMARLRNQITEWGKVWDPVADKLMIGSVIVILLFKLNFSLAILVLAMDLAFIAGGVIYKITASHPIDIQANNWGKIKMNLQCLGAACLIIGFGLNLPTVTFAGEIFFYMSVFFAAMSLLTKGI